MSAQASLALPPTPTPTRSVRRTRGLLAFETKPLAETYLARHGAIFRNEAGGVMPPVRLRATRWGWMLCVWHSGYPWALTQAQRLRCVTRDDVAKEPRDG